MPKKTKYPRLHVRVKKGKNGQVYTYYSFDMRPQGKADIQLGTNRDEAIAKWQQLQAGEIVVKGRIKEAIAKWQEHELPKYANKDTRDGYSKQLRKIEPVFGMAGWHEVTVPVLRAYLEKRTAKTQGNRELSLLSIIWHKAIIWGMTERPWPATGIKGWKNAESAREFEVTDQLFNAVYTHADRILKGCMDMSTATGMRITDAITVKVPTNGVLRHKHHKTGKWVEFDVSQSPVLTMMTEQRQNINANTIMLLASDDGQMVTYAMLRYRWETAREAAALQAESEGHAEFAASIRSMYLRDMRKRAADLAVDLDEASKLLMHSNKALTERHYRTKATKLKAVR